MATTEAVPITRPAARAIPPAPAGPPMAAAAPIVFLPTVRDIGRQLAASLDEWARCDAENDKVGDQIAWERREALRSLATTIPSRSLADAATHVAVAWWLLDDVFTFEKDNDEIDRICRASLRALSSALPFVAAAAGTPINQFGVSAMLDKLCAQRAPMGDIPAAPSAPSGDAELIAACAEFDGIMRRANALHALCRTGADEERTNAQATALYETGRPLLNRICALRAGTPAGMAARVRSLGLACEDIIGDPENEGDQDDTRLVSAVLRDVLALGEAALPTPPGPASPDAALVGYCDELLVLDRERRRRMAAARTADDETRIDAECAPMVARVGELVATVTGLAATTLDGFRSKAAVAQQLAAREADGSVECCGQAEHVAFGLMADLLGDRAQPDAQVEPAADPDAELIRLCRELVDVEAQHAALAANDPVEAALYDRGVALMEQIKALRATTLDGARAKALAITKRILGVPGPTSPHDDYDELTLSLLRDLTEPA